MHTHASSLGSGFIRHRVRLWLLFAVHCNQICTQHSQRQSTPLLFDRTSWAVGPEKLACEADKEAEEALRGSRLVLHCRMLLQMESAGLNEFMHERCMSETRKRLAVQAGMQVYARTPCRSVGRLTPFEPLSATSRFRSPTLLCAGRSRISVRNLEKIQTGSQRICFVVGYTSGCMQVFGQGTAQDTR